MSSREKYYEIIRSEVATALLGGRDILIQSNPGLGKNHLMSLAAKDAGLNLVRVTMPDPDGYFRKDPDFLEKIENSFVSDMQKVDAQVILMDVERDSDISRFESLAKKFKIPLIVSMMSDTDVHIGVFVNKNKLVEAVNKVHSNNNAIQKDDVVAKIKEMQSESANNKVGNKLGM